MADCWVWWIAAALLVGLELVTGTFYLLAVGVAFALGGVAAWFGASVPMQMTIGGTLAVIGLGVAHYWRKRRGMPSPLPVLDRGQAVRVDKWNDDGTARAPLRRPQEDSRHARLDARAFRSPAVTPAFMLHHSLE